MAELDQLFRKTDRDDDVMLENVLHGKVGEDATYGERCAVVIPSFSKRQKYECLWSPQVDDGGDAVLPSKGDRAVVLVDDDNEHWMVLWWPH